MVGSDSEWKMATLASVTKPRREKVSPQKFPDLPYVGLEDVEAHTSRLLSTKRGADYKSSCCRFYSGDVLYGRLRPYLNKVIRPDFDGLASAEFIVFPNTSEIDMNYLRCILSSPQFVGFSSQISQGDRPRVDFTQIGAYEFQLPPIKVQGALVEKFASLQQNIRSMRSEANRASHLVNRLKQRLVESALQGDLSRHTSDKTDWKTVRLEDLIYEGPANGYSPRSSENSVGTLSLKLTATTRGRLDLTEKAVKRLDEIIPDNSKYWLEPGDVLVQRANSLEYVGATAIFAGPPKTYIYPDLMMRIRVEDPILRTYIWRYLNSIAAKKYFQSNATGTAGNMPKINGKVLRALPVRLPGKKELEFIVTLLDRVLQRISLVENDIDLAQRLLEKLESIALFNTLQRNTVRTIYTVDNPATKFVVSEPERSIAMNRKSEMDGDRVPILMILKDSDRALSPDELFMRCGFDSSNVEEVELFFDELRVLVKDKRVEELRPDKITVLLQSRK
ncbi:MAG: restriction endonuclease subunit S [Candidatus Obscuribacterales bacterium]|nr:restriction endonuclease subunit S [Candidatus Obscuribacterales bacterium]